MSVECMFRKAYTTNNTLQRHFTNKTTHSNKHEKHKCSDCPKFYIGQTGRSFITRYTEHIKTLTQPLMISNFAEHIFNTYHLSILLACVLPCYIFYFVGMQILTYFHIPVCKVTKKLYCL